MTTQPLDLRRSSLPDFCIVRCSACNAQIEPTGDEVHFWENYATTDDLTWCAPCAEAMEAE